MQFNRQLIAGAVLVALSSLASANILTFTGTTTGGLTYNRPLEDLSGLSGTGTNVAYAAYSFSVGASGTYTVLTTALFDSFETLYAGTFSPSAPLANAVVANDDLLGSTTSGFSQALTAGITYTLVTTGFANTDVGNFTTTIGGPGLVAAVPEPGSVALLLAGLAGVGFIARRRSEPSKTA